MKIFCTLICLLSLYIVCHSAPQFNNSPQGDICEAFEIIGGSSTTEGIYEIYKGEKIFIEEDLVWKKSGVDRFIFKGKGSKGWKIGKEDHIETSSQYYKSPNQNLPKGPPFFGEETWTSSSNGEVTVKCIPVAQESVVNFRRGCFGELSLFQGETLLKKIAFGDVKGKETKTIPGNRNRNRWHIDSVKATATGDCCFELQANDGSDYEEVHPDQIFPTELSSSFYIYQIDALQDCPEY